MNGKRIMGIMYTSCKRSQKATTHTSEEQKPEEIGGSRVKGEKVSTRVLSVHLAIAAKGEGPEPTVPHKCVEEELNSPDAINGEVRGESSWEHRASKPWRRRQAYYNGRCGDDTMHCTCITTKDGVEESVVPYEVLDTTTFSSSMHEVAGNLQTVEAGIASLDDKVVKLVRAVVGASCGEIHLTCHLIISLQYGEGGDDKISVVLIAPEAGSERSSEGGNLPTIVAEEPPIPPTPIPQGAYDKMSALLITAESGGQPAHRSSKGASHPSGKVHHFPSQLRLHAPINLNCCNVKVCLATFSR
ncbi:hypothetical protein Cgig2_030049 [Carnegiea gigantea]|uniref:Uncharacterized protein n=1 Tax=Carnegiea gigantea TaxID=171969 RepID=A0A9Q1K0T0_9CARY|nr:hypothetical protein Cgig2_030049 [Carnegiea gigantea]